MTATTGDTLDNLDSGNPDDNLDNIELQSHYWSWQGHRIHYTYRGEQGPALLLVHGFGASTDHWRKNIIPLCERYRVYAIDLLGFGRSEKPDVVYTGELWRDQFRAFCEEVIQAPVFVAGNSLGGYAVLCFAADCPEWVRGVILLNCAGPLSGEQAPSPTGWQQQLADLQRQLFKQPWFIELASWVLFNYMRQRSQIRRVLLQVYKDPTAVTDRLVEEIYRPAFDPGALTVFSSVFKSPPGRKLDQLAQGLQCPLLLLWGAADPWMTPSRAERFLHYVPTAKLEYVDAGHCPHDERPEVVNATIDRWVQEQS